MIDKNKWLDRMKAGIEEAKAPEFSIPFIIHEKWQSEDEAIQAAGYTRKQLDGLKHGYKMVYFYESDETFRGQVKLPLGTEYLLQGETARFMQECINAIKIEDMESTGFLKIQSLASLVIIYCKKNNLSFDKLKEALLAINFPSDNSSEKEYKEMEVYP